MNDLRLSGPDAVCWIEASPLGAAMFDSDMRYLAASQKWCRWSNVASSNDLRGRLHYDVFPSLPAHWIAAHRAALAGEEVAFSAEVVTKRNGARVWIRWAVSPWFLETGEIGGITIVKVELGPAGADTDAPPPGTGSLVSGSVDAYARRPAVEAKNVLVVADPDTTGTEIVDYLRGLGAQPAGPYAEINAALDEIERRRFDAAFLDTDLRGALVFPVADELTRKSVPIIFLTAKDPTYVPRRLSASMVLRKPVNRLELTEALTQD